MKIPPKRRLPLFALLAAAFVIGASSANAQVLAGWDFNGLTNYGPSPYAATTTASGVTSGGLMRGAGIITGAGAPANAWGGTGFSNASTPAAASTQGQYIQLTLAPTAGNQISLTDIAPYTISVNNQGPASGQWQYSLDGTNFTAITTINWGQNITNSLRSSIDLSGISALQNVTSTVTLRLVLYNANNSNGTFVFNNFQSGNDLIIDGTVAAIPEPTTMVGALLTTCAIGWSQRRRFKIVWGGLRS
jgi:hypothetical protein